MNHGLMPNLPFACDGVTIRLEIERSMITR
jgi:hypothetical protein